MRDPWSRGKGRPLVAEHDSEREPEEKGAPLGERHGDSRGSGSGGSGSGGSGGSGATSGDTPDEEQQVPFDEDAAWRAIVAGEGEKGVFIGSRVSKRACCSMKGNTSTVQLHQGPALLTFGTAAAGSWTHGGLKLRGGSQPLLSW